LPGETVEKQLVVLNNSRATVACDCGWSLVPCSGGNGEIGRLGNGPDRTAPIIPAGQRRVSLRTGEQERVPLRFPLPVALAPGDYEIRASVRFSTGETQTDSFPLQVLPRPAPPVVTPKIVLFDPKGETARLLEALGVHFERTDPGFDAVTDLTRYDV